MTHILHPELVSAIPFVGDWAQQTLEQRTAETLADNPANDPAITVAVRARNEAAGLEKLLQDVSRQIVGHEVEIVVVDNDSADGTADVARAHNATVVTLPQEDFTYPRSMNLAMQAASNDAVFLTVAHAQLATTHTLHAGARHFVGNEDLGGVFAAALPSADASRTWWTAGIMSAAELRRQTHRVTRAGMGVMAATGALFSKTVWKDLGGFDERYETGGEDTKLAKEMLRNGFGIKKEPGMTVHHAHPDGPFAMARELVHYQRTLLGPQSLRGNVRTRRQSRFEK